jgi:hypothetical protein
MAPEGPLASADSGVPADVSSADVSSEDTGSIDDPSEPDADLAPGPGIDSAPLDPDAPTSPADSSPPAEDTSASDRLLMGADLKVHSVSVNPSQAPYAIDGNTGSRYLMQGTWPLEIVFDLDATQIVTGLRYIESWSSIKDYEIYVSDDAAAFGTPIATGVMPDGLVRDVAVPPTPGRFVRLRTLSSTNGGRYCYITEAGIYIR